MSDKYDDAVKYLVEKPSQIYSAWVDPLNHPAGCLFQFVTPTGNCEHNRMSCGCLTTIRGQAPACTPDLTARIRADGRLPISAHSITVDVLPVFAEWQRILDKELGRAA